MARDFIFFNQVQSTSKSDSSGGGKKLVLFRVGPPSLLPLCPGSWEGASSPRRATPSGCLWSALVPQSPAALKHLCWVQVWASLRGRETWCWPHHNPHSQGTSRSPHLLPVPGESASFCCSYLCSCTGLALSLPLWHRAPSAEPAKALPGPGGEKAVFTASAVPYPGTGEQNIQRTKPNRSRQSDSSTAVKPTRHLTAQFITLLCVVGKRNKDIRKCGEGRGGPIFSTREHVAAVQMARARDGSEIQLELGEAVNKGPEALPGRLRLRLPTPDLQTQLSRGCLPPPPPPSPRGPSKCTLSERPGPPKAA